MHYIGMAGLHGCLPNACDVYESRELAAESLARLHDKGKRWERDLARRGYAFLSIRKDGNEYAEIIECGCNDPSSHSDSGL